MKVSVVIPFFNRTELLRDALASVLAQTLPAHEIIAVDDCSPEDTGWLQAEFPSVSVLRMDKNGGPARARYHGVKAATGTHVATLDMDDHWYPDKLEKQVAYVEKIGDPGGLYAHRQWVVEKDGGSVRPLNLPSQGEPISEYLYVRNGMLQANSLLMLREVYMEVCKLSETEFLEDYEMGIVADVKKHRIYVQGDSLSQWNCISDPRRISLGKREQRQLALLKRTGSFFTPKARAAFEGRILAPLLALRGDYSGAAKLIAYAVRMRALTFSATVKLVVYHFSPRTFHRLAHSYNRLRLTQLAPVSGQPTTS